MTRAAYPTLTRGLHNAYTPHRITFFPQKSSYWLRLNSGKTAGCRPGLRPATRWHAGPIPVPRRAAGTFPTKCEDIQ